MSKTVQQKTERLTLERVKKLDTNRRRYKKIAGSALDTFEKLLSENQRLERDLSFYKNQNGNENDMLLAEINRYLDSVDFEEDDDELKGYDYEIEVYESSNVTESSKTSENTKKKDCAGSKKKSSKKN